jgi:hypothetical protein
MYFSHNRPGDKGLQRKRLTELSALVKTTAIGQQFSSAPIHNFALKLGFFEVISRNPRR